MVLIALSDCEHHAETLGAIDVIPKPIDFDRMLTIVRRYYQNLAVPIHDAAMSFVMYVLVSTGAVGLVLAALKWRRRRHRIDSGSVSERWIVEHRAEPHDPSL